MWNNQSGGGYDNGGGYLNSPNVGSSQPQTKQTRQRAQSIMPCTVAQIKKAEQVDDKFLIENIELNQVVLVGLVRSSHETSTRLDYQIDDMTSEPLEVRQFVDNDENTPDNERTSLIRENIYVRVHGHMRAFGGKRSVVAFRICPITDMNELTTHILEVIHAHAHLAHGGIKPADVSMQQTSTGRTPSATVTSGSTGNVGGQLDIGLKTEQQQVLNVLRMSMDEQGMSIATVCGRLRNMSQNAIRDCIEFLSSEGHIYSTIDDEHYKSTDSC